jgi:hypothetical protein
MEPLPAATLAGLTPRDVDVRFYDDRMEVIPFDEPTDLVAISVETYTAKRAYQIASEYRRRGVPVVMGGFHASALSRRGRPARRERGDRRGGAHLAAGGGRRPTRSPAKILPPGNPTLARGVATRPLHLPRQTLPADRPGRGRARVPLQVRLLRRADRLRRRRRAARSTTSSPSSRAIKHEKKLFFFVDDNITSNLAQAKEFFRALIPLGCAG